MTHILAVFVVTFELHRADLKVIQFILVLLTGRVNFSNDSHGWPFSNYIVVNFHRWIG